MRLRILQCLTILAVLAIAVPIWARSKSAELRLTEPATIGTTQLEPGAYTLKVDDGGTQVSVVRQGKVVAQVPHVGGGAFGAARLARIVAELQSRLLPAHGQRTGRPTDANWVRRPKVPMSKTTERRLMRLAQRASADRKSVV